MPLADLVNDHLFDIDGVTVGTGGEWPALSSVEGLDSIPEYRVLDSEKPQDHGSFQLGSDYMQTRVVEMTIGMEDDYGSTTYQAKIDALKRVMRPRHINNEMILRWRYNGENARRLYCRPRRCNMPIDEISYHGIRRAESDRAGEGFRARRIRSARPLLVSRARASRRVRSRHES